METCMVDWLFLQTDRKDAGKLETYTRMMFFHKSK